MYKKKTFLAKRKYDNNAVDLITHTRARISTILNVQVFVPKFKTKYIYIYTNTWVGTSYIIYIIYILYLLGNDRFIFCRLEQFRLCIIKMN